MKPNEVGGTCGTCVGEGEVHTGFWWVKPEGKTRLGRLRRKWEDTKIKV